MNLTNEDIEEIIRILDASFYDELRLATGTFEISLRRSAAGWTQERRTIATPRVEEATQPSIGSAATAPTAATETTADADGVVAVRAPMVGTFYRAPKPGAQAFVEVGTTVGEQTVVGIIEVMKLMNSVASGASGTVAEICAENGALVEAGQVLMRLRQAP